VPLKTLEDCFPEITVLPVYAASFGYGRPGEHRYPDRNQLRPYYGYPNQLDVRIIRSGHGRLEIGGKPHVLTTGQCLTVLDAEHLRFHIESPYRYSYVCCRLMDRGGNDLLPDGCVLPPKIRMVSDPSLIHTHIQRIEHCLSLIDNSWLYVPRPATGVAPVQTAMDWARAMLREIIHVDNLLASAQISPSATTVQELCALVRQDPAKWGRVSALAEKADLSVQHLGRLFRRYTELSPKAYIVRQRMNAACRLLLETDMSVGDIAERLGYANRTAFWHQFKQHTGSTPAQYRKLQRQ